MRPIDATPYRLYLIYSAVASFVFALAYTVATVYRVEAAGLNPLQLVLVGTTLEVTYFLFNVPTGVIADTYSRRLSILAGVGFWGCGMLLEGSFPTFLAIVLAQVVMGIGYTLVEGALEAWLTDEIGEASVGAALLRGSQVGRIAGFLGIVAAVAVASVRLAWTFQLAGVLILLLGGYLGLTMREPGFHRPTRAEAIGVRARSRRALGEMGGTTRQAAALVRRRPLALTILAVAAIYGGHTEGLDRLWQAHLLDEVGLPDLGRLDPVVWFGIVQAAVMLLGIVAAEGIRRRLDLAHPAVAVRALTVFEATMMAGVIAFALADRFLTAAVAYLVAGTARGLRDPVYTAWINQGIDPQVRATVLSMSAQADALGQFTVGPGLGVIGNRWGVRSSLVVAGIVLAPTVWLFARAARQLTASARQSAPAPDPTSGP